MEAGFQVFNPDSEGRPRSPVHEGQMHIQAITMITQ